LIVEYGRAIYPDAAAVSAFKAGGMQRRKVCNELLERIEDGMKSVIVSMPNYETLQLVHTARRLYRLNHPSALEKQDLNRRFAYAFKELLLRSDGNPPQEFLELKKNLHAYQQELVELGIRDYQVPGLDRERYEIDADTTMREMRIVNRTIQLIFIILVALIPGLLLNLPVKLISHWYVERRRKLLLSKSNVKINAHDVVLTERVVFCVALVPTLWLTYCILLSTLTDWEGPTIALITLFMPISSYWGIVVTEAGMVNLKDLRPYIMRIFPSSRRRLAALPAARKKLRHDLRQLVKEIGPTMGDLYFGKEVDWTSIQEQIRRKQQQLKKSE